MNLKQYQPLALRTAKHYGSVEENLQHAAIGLITESGEFASIMKGMAVYEKPYTDEMRKHVNEELGDCFWYCAIGFEAVGWSMNTLASRLIDHSTFLHTPMSAALTLGSSVGLFVDSVQNRPSDLPGIAQGLATVMFILMDLSDQFCQGEDVLQQNINKLMLRFPEKFTNHDAEARADKGGVDARNS